MRYSSGSSEPRTRVPSAEESARPARPFPWTTWCSAIPDGRRREARKRGRAHPLRLEHPKLAVRARPCHEGVGHVRPGATGPGQVLPGGDAPRLVGGDRLGVEHEHPLDEPAGVCAHPVAQAHPGALPEGIEAPVRWEEELDVDEGGVEPFSLSVDDLAAALAEPARDRVPLEGAEPLQELDLRETVRNHVRHSDGELVVEPVAQAASRSRNGSHSAGGGCSRRMCSAMAAIVVRCPASWESSIRTRYASSMKARNST